MGKGRKCSTGEEAQGLGDPFPAPGNCSGCGGAVVLTQQGERVGWEGGVRERRSWGLAGAAGGGGSAGGAGWPRVRSQRPARRPLSGLARPTALTRRCPAKQIFCPWRR